MENKYINEEMCAECKGACCKKGGCQYSTQDFESLKFEYLLKKLNEGYISIVAALDPRVINGRKVMYTHLYIKSRNEGRPIIDLYSLRTRCSALTEVGCKYDVDNRPSGGINLVPAQDENGRCCYPETDPMEYIKMWEPHQTVLRRLVKHFTGKTVENQLREDIYNLFTSIFYQRFEGVSPEEIESVLGDQLMLSTYFEDVVIKAINDYIKVNGKLPQKVRTR